MSKKNRQVNGANTSTVTEEVRNQQVAEGTSNTVDTSTNGSSRGEAEKNPGPFATLEDAKEHPPTNKNFRLFEVTSPSGEVTYSNARDGGRAIATCAKVAGWTAKQHGRTVNPSSVAGILRGLTPEQKAELEAMGIRIEM
jgi:hypothetical protein